ncbi:MAG: Zn-ribbon domain-containing OB-fold protein [Candidatus Thorarchaeota archaeon]|jgi:uncharacterized OB-fold protein
MSEKPTVEEYLKNIQEGKFRAYSCSDCGMIIAPPSGACYGCGGTKMNWADVSGKGKLVSFTVIHIPPPEFKEEAPYIVAIVELEEGTRITSRLLGVDPHKPEDIKIDTPLTLEYERGHSGKLYLAFRPE